MTFAMIFMALGIAGIAAIVAFASNRRKKAQ